MRPWKRFVAPMLARQESLTPLGAIPSGIPLGEALLLEASVSLYVEPLSSGIFR